MIALAGLALLLSTSPHGAMRDPPRTTLWVGQIHVERRGIVRVPLGPRRGPLTVWRERRAPRCIDASNVAGAAVTPEGAVDFVLKGGRRMRAWLESECPALDFYQGFYVKPDDDNKVCAGRDSIHSRSGGECQIDRFRILEAVGSQAPR